MVEKRVIAFSLILLSVLAVSMLVTAENGTYSCEEDSDCVEVVDSNNCCTFSCRELVNKTTLGENSNLTEYVSGTNYYELYNQSIAGCSCEASCTTVVNEVKCVENVCKFVPLSDETSCEEDSDCDEGYECEDNICVLDDEENETNDDSEDSNKICCMMTKTENRQGNHGNETQIRTKYEYEKEGECISDDEYAAEVVENNMCNSQIECEFNDRKQRLKCQFEHKDEIRARIVEKYKEYNDDAEIYEACQGLRNKGLCVAIYAQSQSCFNKEGTERDRCFKRVANFTQAKIGDEINNSENKTIARERIRHYMALILDNLQHRVDRALNASLITEDEAATLTDKIIEIKRAVVEGSSKEEVRTMLQELKEMWRSYIGDIENE